MEIRRQKELVVGASVALISMLAFFVAALVLPQPPMAATLAVVVALSVLWALVVCLELGLAEHWGSGLISIAVPVVSVVVAGRLSAGALVGAVLLLIALLLARRSVRRELTSRITYRTAEVFGPALRLVLFGLILALAGLALPVLEASLVQGTIALTAEQVGALTHPLAPVLESFSPNITAESTVDEIINQKIEQELPPGVEVSAEQREQIRQQVAQQLATPLTGRESINTVIARQINTWLQAFTETSPVLFALSIIIILLLAVRTVVPLAAWLLLPVLAGMVWIGRRIGLVRLVESTVSVDRLSF
jgi:hypothetical protein